MQHSTTARRPHGPARRSAWHTALTAALLAGALHGGAQAAVACAGLAAQTVPASAIGLPTRGAVVDGAVVVAATASVGEYCQLQGRILPVDLTAPPIRFQLNLPLVWNQKALQYGGGGFDGTLVTGTGNMAHALPGSATPLQRGYATFGSDSGHTGLNVDGRFALNDEALRNFTGESIKKLRDVAQQLIVRRYGQPPWKTYMQGGSSGGRESLAAVQRWPQDYDGVVAHYPVLQYVPTALQANRIMKALYGPGGFVSSAKMNHLNNQVLAACDALDGVADGLVNNVAACHVDPAALRCPGNIDWGPTCLTDAQINTVRTYADDHDVAFPLANGLTRTPGYNILAGANFGGPVDVGWYGQLLDKPTLVLNGYLAVVQSQWLKYFVTADPAYDPLGFDPLTAGAWRARVQQLSAWHDATSTDLTPFMQRGGKVLMLHGTSDTIVSPRGVIDWHGRLQQRYGAAPLRDHLRFYTVAGFGHGEGRYTVGWNALDLLEAWVEAGQAPAAPVSRDVLNLAGRTRPLCEHPSFPRYVGGPVNSAASFRCALH